MTALEAVLLDMDGTLCDTEPAWIASEFAIAERYGARWTREDGLALVGNDLIASGRYVKQRMGLSLTPEQIVDEMIDGVCEAVRREGVQWRPGALDLVSDCGNFGMPIALVTMSYARFAKAIVAAMPVGRFDAVVTGDEVTRGKPAPDAYLTAAALLSADPAACVAIEDSATGAAAAQAAGCLVVVVPHQVPVPAAPDRRELATLKGVTVRDLRRWMSQR
ncbi:MAG: HAD family hydrolase [Nocardioidaceae bacterium]